MRFNLKKLAIDRVFPKSLGGSDALDNLALACHRSNERRYHFVAGLDPETQDIVPLCNPRKQQWAEHFVWQDDGVVIEGTTPIRRTTCLRLDLNDTRYSEEDSIRATRRFWIQTGLHPPAGDPCQAGGSLAGSQLTLRGSGRKTEIRSSKMSDHHLDLSQI